jgi:hypothetical protein
MKKTLTLIVLTGLMLTGCGGKEAATQAPEPTASTTAVAEVVDTVAVPGVLSLTLDEATEQLENLGFEVDSVDILDGKTIIIKKNWQVMSQDAAEGTQEAKGATVHLGVKSLEALAAEKAAADKAAADKAAAVKAAADKAAAVKAAAVKAAADKAAADKAAAAKRVADAAAAKLAAEQAAAQQAAVQQAPAAPVAPVAPAAPPAAAYYANCAAARAAGAAPLYSGQAGYSTSLDRDRDGVACE